MHSKTISLLSLECFVSSGGDFSTECIRIRPRRAAWARPVFSIRSWNRAHLNRIWIMCKRMARQSVGARYSEAEHLTASAHQQHIRPRSNASDVLYRSAMCEREQAAPSTPESTCRIGGCIQPPSSPHPNTGAHWEQTSVKCDWDPAAFAPAVHAGMFAEPILSCLATLWNPTPNSSSLN